MKRHTTLKRKMVAFTALVLLLASIPAVADEWKLAKNMSGIKVYTKTIPGSVLKAVKAEMTVRTTLSSLIALMTDFDSFTRWYPQMKVFTCVKEINKLEFYIHIMTDAPWPVKDRDSLCHFKIFQDPADKSINIEYTDLPGILPEEPGIIRVKKLYGLFRFTPVNGDRVLITYETHSDPGGKIPAWMANATTTERPYKIFKNMKKMVMKDKYQNTICDSYRAMNNLN